MDEVTRPDYVSPENNQSNSIVNNSVDIQETKAPEKKKSTKGLKITAWIAGLALAGAGGIIGIDTLRQANENGPGSSESPKPVETTHPADWWGDYIVDPDTLSKMSDDDIVKLATISVESVTVDGKIDWNLYSKKITDIQELGTVAGMTKSELIDSLFGPNVNQSLTDEERLQILATKYDDLFFKGYATPSLDASGYKGAHLSMLLASVKNHFNSGDVPIQRSLTLIDSKVLASSSDGASIELTQRSTDNYFSSGTFRASSSRDVDALNGRTADLDETFKQIYNVVIENGNIYLNSTSNE